MTDENSALLQRYAAGKSEAAFSDLVQRNINMVYSAALRQTGGDASAAEDITQAVFTDLARKAPLLTGHSSLTGWLYTSTRFLAAKTRRAEQRRRAREHQAHVMNQILESPGSDPAWEELRPVIDDAMQDLSAVDRETVLLRYFDGQRLAEIGTRLGISENAARMRVDRAIDKLREALARRGVTSTAAAVGSLLARNAVKAAPAGLSARVSRAAWKPSSFGPMAGILALLPSFKVQLAVVSAVLVLAGASFMFLRSPAGSPGGRVEASSSTADQDSAPEPSGRGSSGTQAPDLSGALASEPVNTNTLLLEVVSADSGKPIPSVTISAWIWHSKKIDAKKFRSTQPGICEVRLPEDEVTQLTLASRADGFADTRLEWRTERGQAIPQRYTLRVARATPLGGRVVDADGNPVADAEVGFNNETSPAQEGTGPQTDNFGWPFWVTARTDDQGRWRLDRVAAEAIRTLYGSASHSNYVASQTIWLNKDANARQELLEGTHTFSLGRAVAVSGMVITQEGQAVPGATVLVGNIGSRDRRETKSAADGSFAIVGCKPGKNLLSANAKGFAPVTLEAELAADSQPFTLTLQPGNVLRLQVVNTSGQPIPKAGVWLDTFQRRPKDSPAPSQVQFNKKTDAQGRLEWDAAPAGELRFGISASGYMRLSDVILRADNTEHLITLPDALVISGTVRDTSTGLPIPKFRIITGWPSSYRDATQVSWSSLDRFWMTFEGGRFKHVFEEPVVGGTTERNFVFKFEADGYAPFISRVVKAEEAKVEFDIALQPAASSVVTVLLPDGRPAAGADVGLVSPGANLNLLHGTFDRTQSGGHLSRADSQGKFKLLPDSSITRVIVAHPDGFAEATMESIVNNPLIILQPWGRIEGTYFSGGAPVAGAELFIQLHPTEISVRCDLTAYRLTTGSDGRFIFPQVPPGKRSLVRLVPQGQNTWTHKVLQEVEVSPGQITQVTLGGGHIVTARPVWPAGLVRQPDWHVKALLAPSKSQFRDSSAQPGVIALPSARPLEMVEAPSGAFRAEDVPAGEYVLYILVFEPPAAQAQAPTPIAKAQMAVVLPSDQPSSILDLGEAVLTLVE